MTDPHDRTGGVRRRRADSAAATGTFQRSNSLWLALTIGVIGGFMTLSAVLYPSGYGLAGGVCVVAGAALILVADRQRVETVEAADRPAHRRELGWYLVAVALVAGGVVLTIHPW